MKKILITGANSYIGTSFEKYMEQYDGYQIDTLDMMNPKWRNHDFSKYDVVFHVAGIAHADIGCVSEETKSLYYKVNTELTVETATLAKQSGVKQFIYMSSIIVYGESAPLGKKKIITPETKPEPANFYGDSKLQADLKLSELNDSNFKICILRPPMIYGPGCKGNYQMLSKLAKKLPVFPDIKNERSMLYVGNLCYFIKECIDKENIGIYFPQNSEYVSTSQLVEEIARVNGKNIRLTKLLNILVFIASKMPGKVHKLCDKAFGSIIYDIDINSMIQYYDLQKSIKKTENKLSLNRHDNSYEISVLMSVYKNDRSNQLEEAIKSIMNQTVSPKQFVIVIDGPIDESLNEVLIKYKNKYTEIIELKYLKKNGGLGNALNVGIKLCKNEFIARMDSDDISKPDRFEMQIKEFENDSNLDILGTQIDEFIDDIGNIVSKRIVPCDNGEIIRFSHRRSPFNHPTVMYRKSAIEECGGYCSYGRKEDLELFVRMVNEGYKAQNLSKSYLWYRTNNDNLARRRTWINCKEYIAIMFTFYRKKYLNILDLLYVVIGQLIMYLMPKHVVKVLNKKYLRKGDSK